MAFGTDGKADNDFCTDGKVDRDFGTDGKADNDFGTDGKERKRNGGKILVCGTIYTYPDFWKEIKNDIPLWVKLIAPQKKLLIPSFSFALGLD